MEGKHTRLSEKTWHCFETCKKSQNYKIQTQSQNYDQWYKKKCTKMAKIGVQKNKKSLKTIDYKCEVCISGWKATKLMAGNSLFFYQFMYSHLASRQALRILPSHTNSSFSFSPYQQKSYAEVRQVLFEKNIKMRAKILTSSKLIFLDTERSSGQ